MSRNSQIFIYNKTVIAIYIYIATTDHTRSPFGVNFELASKGCEFDKKYI